MTVAELDLILGHVGAVGAKVDDLAVRFAAHCAAEEALLRRSPLVAAIAAMVSSLAAVVSLAYLLWR
jgi:hypothetical protein